MLTRTQEVRASLRSPAVIASVSDLKVYFRSKRGVAHAVDGVTFDIRDGETFGLVGETGCGKSVTARSFLRLVPMPPGILAGGSILFRPRRVCPDCDGQGCSRCDQTGRIAAACPKCAGTGCRECAGRGEETIDLLEISEARMRDIRGNRIAMIFQDPGKALNPALSIRDQIAEVFFQHRSQDILDSAGIDASTGGVAAVLLRRRAMQRSRMLEDVLLALPLLRSRRNRIRKAVDTMVAAALAETQIPNPLKIMARYPHELSGGMRQRVMIAQALACNPDLLIADEPTTALDVTVQAKILELIRELQQRRQTAVLYISHDLSLVRRVCDRIGVMYAGRVVEVGSSERIFEAPCHPYTRGLLAAIPSTAQPRGQLAAIKGTVPELVDPQPSCRFAGRCPYEAGVCSRLDPPVGPVADEHSVACFIYHTVAESGDQPSFERRIR